MTQNKIILIVLLALTPLFFTAHSASQHTLLEKRLWDAGHFPFFMLLTFAFLPYVRTKIQVFGKPVFVVFQLFFLIFILAAGIEVIQSMVGRQASLGDLRKDVLGTVIICQAFLFSNNYIKKYRRLAGLFTLCWALFELHPLLEAALDRWNQVQSIPVLANFETDRELFRWNYGTYERYLFESPAYPQNSSTDRKKNKNHVLKISLNTDTFTGIAGVGLHPDWSGYSDLKFDFHNPNEYPLRLNVKIEDGYAMEIGRGYDNRYNSVYSLNPGHNTIHIALTDVAEGPENRVLDLSDIRRLSFFFSKLSAPSFVYLDNVVLTQ
ncbi:MAG: VanZ family protein [Pseudomonadales bacterium]|nr:VanZ family protein [Pseudomonadales bacterium]